MTKLQPGQSVTRQTGATVTDRGQRPLIAKLTDRYLILKPKGLRSGEVYVDMAALYVHTISKQCGVEPCRNPATRL